MNSLTSVMSAMRGMEQLYKGDPVDLDALESLVIELQRECLSGGAVVGGLLAAADFKDKGVADGVLEDAGYLTALLSTLAYEVTNWLDDISQAKASRRHRIKEAEKC